MLANSAKTLREFFSKRNNEQELKMISLNYGGYYTIRLFGILPKVELWQISNYLMRSNFHVDVDGVHKSGFEEWAHNVSIISCLATASPQRLLDYLQEELYFLSNMNDPFWCSPLRPIRNAAWLFVLRHTKNYLLDQYESLFANNGEFSQIKTKLMTLDVQLERFYSIALQHDYSNEINIWGSIVGDGFQKFTMSPYYFIVSLKKLATYKANRSSLLLDCPEDLLKLLEPYLENKDLFHDDVISASIELCKTKHNQVSTQKYLVALRFHYFRSYVGSDPIRRLLAAYLNYDSNTEIISKQSEEIRKLIAEGLDNLEANFPLDGYRFQLIGAITISTEDSSLRKGIMNLLGQAFNRNTLKRQSYLRDQAGDSNSAQIINSDGYEVLMQTYFQTLKRPHNLNEWDSIYGMFSQNIGQETFLHLGLLRSMLMPSVLLQFCESQNMFQLLIKLKQRLHDTSKNYVLVVNNGVAFKEPLPNNLLGLMMVSFMVSLNISSSDLQPCLTNTIPPPPITDVAIAVFQAACAKQIISSQLSEGNEEKVVEFEPFYKEAGQFWPDSNYQLCSSLREEGFRLVQGGFMHSLPPLIGCFFQAYLNERDLFFLMSIRQNGLENNSKSATEHEIYHLAKFITSRLTKPVHEFEVDIELIFCLLDTTLSQYHPNGCPIYETVYCLRLMNLAVSLILLRIQNRPFLASEPTLGGLFRRIYFQVVENWILCDNHTEFKWLVNQFPSIIQVCKYFKLPLELIRSIGRIIEAQKGVRKELIEDKFKHIFVPILKKAELKSQATEEQIQELFCTMAGTLCDANPLIQNRVLLIWNNFIKQDSSLSKVLSIEVFQNFISIPNVLEHFHSKRLLVKGGEDLFNLFLNNLMSIAEQCTLPVVVRLLKCFQILPNHSYSGLYTPSAIQKASPFQIFVYMVVSTVMKHQSAQKWINLGLNKLNEPLLTLLSIKSEMLPKPFWTAVRNQIRSTKYSSEMDLAPINLYFKGLCYNYLDFKTTLGFFTETQDQQIVLGHPYFQLQEFFDYLLGQQQPERLSIPIVDMIASLPDRGYTICPKSLFHKYYLKDQASKKVNNRQILRLLVERCPFTEYDSLVPTKWLVKSGLSLGAVPHKYIIDKLTSIPDTFLTKLFSTQQSSIAGKKQTSNTVCRFMAYLTTVEIVKQQSKSIKQQLSIVDENKIESKGQLGGQLNGQSKGQLNGYQKDQQKKHDNNQSELQNHGHPQCQINDWQTVSDSNESEKVLSDDDYHNDGINSDSSAENSINGNDDTSSDEGANENSNSNSGRSSSNSSNCHHSSDSESFDNNSNDRLQFLVAEGPSGLKEDYMHYIRLREELHVETLDSYNVFSNSQSVKVKFYEINAILQKLPIQIAKLLASRMSQSFYKALQVLTGCNLGSANFATKYREPVKRAYLNLEEKSSYHIEDDESRSGEDSEESEENHNRFASQSNTVFDEEQNLGPTDWGMRALREDFQDNLYPGSKGNNKTRNSRSDEMDEEEEDDDEQNYQQKNSQCEDSDQQQSVDKSNANNIYQGSHRKKKRMIDEDDSDSDSDDLDKYELSEHSVNSQDQSDSDNQSDEKVKRNWQKQLNQPQLRKQTDQKQVLQSLPQTDQKSPSQLSRLSLNDEMYEKYLQVLVGGFFLTKLTGKLSKLFKSILIESPEGSYRILEAITTILKHICQLEQNDTYESAYIRKMKQTAILNLQSIASKIKYAVITNSFYSLEQLKFKQLSIVHSINGGSKRYNPVDILKIVLLDVSKGIFKRIMKCISNDQAYSQIKITTSGNIKAILAFCKDKHFRLERAFELVCLDYNNKIQMFMMMQWLKGTSQALAEDLIKEYKANWVNQADPNVLETSFEPYKSRLQSFHHFMTPFWSSKSRLQKNSKNILTCEGLIQLMQAAIYMVKKLDETFPPKWKTKGKSSSGIKLEQSDESKKDMFQTLIRVIKDIMGLVARLVPAKKLEWYGVQQVKYVFSKFNAGELKCKDLPMAANLILSLLHIEQLQNQQMKSYMNSLFELHPQVGHGVSLQFKMLYDASSQSKSGVQVNRKCSFQYAYLNYKRNSISVNYIGEQGSDQGALLRDLMRGWQGVPTSDECCFLGKLMGMCFLDGIPFGGLLDLPMCAYIRGTKLTEQFYRSYDIQIYNSIIYVKQNDPQPLGLTFSVVKETPYGPRQFGLSPNGSTKLVTEHNKQEYLQLYMSQYLYLGRQQQLKEVLIGWMSQVKPKLIRHFTYEQLYLCLKGKTIISVQQFKHRTTYANYSANSLYIKWFWQILQQLPQHELGRFIKFLTGNNNIGLGMSSLKMNINRQYETNRLPVAHGCYYQLDLPQYKSKDILRHKLLQAIYQGADGFYIA